MASARRQPPRVAQDGWAGEIRRDAAELALRKVRQRALDVVGRRDVQRPVLYVRASKPIPPKTLGQIHEDLQGVDLRILSGLSSWPHRSRRPTSKGRGPQFDMVTEGIPVEERSYAIPEHDGHCRDAGVEVRFEGRRCHDEVVNHEQRVHGLAEHFF